MTQKFRMYQRSNGRFYLEDNATGKQESLGTSDKAEAPRLLVAWNEAEQQSAFNFQIVRTYLAAGDPALAKRTWKDVVDAFSAARVPLGRNADGDAPKKITRTFTANPRAEAKAAALLA